jgi:hypothetical protein
MNEFKIVVWIKGQENFDCTFSECSFTAETNAQGVNIAKNTCQKAKCACITGATICDPSGTGMLYIFWLIFRHFDVELYNNLRPFGGLGRRHWPGNHYLQGSWFRQRALQL